MIKSILIYVYVCVWAPLQVNLVNGLRVSCDVIDKDILFPHCSALHKHQKSFFDFLFPFILKCVFPV